jgi:hypothetical protein
MGQFVLKRHQSINEMARSYKFDKLRQSRWELNRRFTNFQRSADLLWIETRQPLGPCAFHFLWLGSGPSVRKLGAINRRKTGEQTLNQSVR